MGDAIVTVCFWHKALQCCCSCRCQSHCRCRNWRCKRWGGRRLPRPRRNPRWQAGPAGHLCRFNARHPACNVPAALPRVPSPLEPLLDLSATLEQKRRFLAPSCTKSCRRGRDNGRRPRYLPKITASISSTLHVTHVALVAQSSVQVPVAACMRGLHDSGPSSAEGTWLQESFDLSGTALLHI